MALGSLNTLDETGGDVAALRSVLGPLRRGVAESGRFGLAVNSAARGRLYVAPWSGPEPFFRDGRGQAELDASDAADAGAIDEFLADAGDLPLAYGYPLFCGDDGMLTPLLYCDVAVRDDGGRKAVVKRSGAAPRLHHAPLIAAGFDRTAVEAAAEAVEHGSYRSLADCLTQVFALIGWSDAPFDDAALSALPETPQPGWHNAAALFLRPSGPAHRKLIDELERLESLYGEAINPTALHALAVPSARGPAPATTAMTEIAPTTPDLPPALQSCLQAPLTAIQAPPGTGKPTLILDLIASLVIDGQSVLLINPSAQALDHYAGRLQALVAPDQHWIPRPGGADMLDLLLQSIEHLQSRPADLADRRAGQATLQTLADQRQNLAALIRQVDAVRKAHRHLATRQRWRRGQRAEVSETWLPLYDQKVRLDIDPADAEAWRDEARRPDDRRARGRRAGGQPPDREALTARLEEMLAPLPTLLRDELLGPARKAADEEAALAALADAFDELARYAEWRRASVHEAQAVEMVLGAPTGEGLLQQFGLTQREIAATARDLLRSTWQAALSANLNKAAERLANSFDAMDRRALAAGTQHAVGERQLGKVIGALTRQYPVWMVSADEAAMRLPLVDGLFDVVVVDDADLLPAPALLPLLARGRRAVVLGALAGGSAAAPADALTLCWAARGAARHRLEAQSRSHPQIVEYLAGAFHGGALSPVVDFPMLGESVPAALQGLHWHEAPEDGPTTPVETAAELAAGWLKAPLVDPGRPFTVGIVAADPEMLAALDTAIGERGLGAVAGERLLVGAPERFVGTIVDLLVLIPGIGSDGSKGRNAHLAANRTVFHDAAAAVRGGLHVVGEADACLQAGGFAGALAMACRSLAEAKDAAAEADAARPLRPRLSALLTRSGLAWWPVRGGYRVVGTLGQLYHVELPGEAADGERVAADDPVLVPAIVDPFDLRRGGDKLKARLDRLV